MQESIKVSYHRAKFGDCRHCGSGDDFSFSRDLTRPRDLIEGSCDFMGRSPSWQITVLP